MNKERLGVSSCKKEQTNKNLLVTIKTNKWTWEGHIMGDIKELGGKRKLEP